VQTFTRSRTHKISHRIVLVAAAFLLLGGGGLLMHQIIIRIHDDKGNEVAQVKVPEGGSVTFEMPDGKTLKLPQKAPKSADLLPQPSGVGATADPTPPALALPGGAPLNPLALVSRPAPLDGVQSWTIETVGHRGPVQALAYSPDGRLLASAGWDGAVRLWDAQTNKLARVLVGRAANVGTLAWSPDSKMLAAGSWSGRGVVIWEVASGRKLRTVEEEQMIYSLSWSADGKSLATGGHERVRVWDVATGDPLVAPVGQHLVAYAPDGQTLFVGTIITPGQPTELGRLVDAATGKIKRHLPLDNLTVQMAAWSPDSKTLALALGGSLTGQAQRLLLLDAATGKVARTITAQDLGGPKEGSIQQVAWSPDGKTLAAYGSFGGGNLLLMDSATAKPARVFPLAQHHIYSNRPSLAWSPDGNTLALGGSLTGAIVLHDIAALTQDYVLPGHVGYACNDLHWSADGRTLTTIDVATNHDRVHVWDVQSGKLLQAARVPSGYFHARSPDGKTVAAAHGDEVRLIAGESQKPLQVLKGHTARVVGLAWSADGRTLATGGDDKTVRLWDVADVAKAHLQKTWSQPQAIAALAFSPDGQWLAALDNSSRTYLRETDAGKLLRRWDRVNGSARALAWSPNGKILAVGGEPSPAQALEVVHFYNAETGKPLHGFPAHGVAVTRLAWSPDGGTLATAGLYGAAVRLWHAASGRPQGVLVPLGEDKALALSPDGHYRGTPLRFEREIVYVAQTDQGQETLTPEEFAKKYGWKNDPARVRLNPPAETVPQAAVDPDRQVAEWVLQMGGRLGLAAGGQHQSVRTADQLPPHHFQVLVVNLNGRREVTDADLARLRGLTNLQSLLLWRTSVTDAGLDHLQGLAGLQILDLRATRITASGLAKLKGLTALRSLTLQETQVTDDGLVHLQGLKQLYQLHLGGNGITDAGMVHLKGMTHLTQLNLIGAQLTDAGLEHLQAMKNLVYLNLKGTRVTAARVKALRAALPRCKIEADDGPAPGAGP
jgi:WD40 repeat protein